MNAQDTLFLKHFPIVVKSECKELGRIYPLKQKEAAEIYEIAAQFPFVKRVFVFGSSTTGRCHIDSDLDICIDADTDDGMQIFQLQKAIGDLCNWNCDIVMYSNIGNRLKDTIKREGVILYEQPSS